MNVESSDAEVLLQDNVKIMLDACFTGKVHIVQELIAQNAVYACQQEETTGRSPLMAAAAAGNGALCQYLLEAGAPWNAVDRQGNCAGNYATDNQHWGVVNLLVDWGVRAELILGAMERNHSRHADGERASREEGSTRPVEHEPSTKPGYLRQQLQYTADGRALLDQDKDAVMMEWERPLMDAHAQILMGAEESGQRRVLNVGFGMGIVDTSLQRFNPSLHIVIEAHEAVYKHMINAGWDKKPNTRVCFGRWQDIVPQLIKEGVVVDSIFYDTYGEHFLDMEEFHGQMVSLLSKPHGIYSFFNGLAPDNIFFHGVACQCVKLQLSQLGLDTEFLPCEIQVKDDEWEGIRRKYWHGRDTYYLPIVKWNHDFLATGRISSPLEDIQKTKVNNRGHANDDSKRTKYI